MDQLNISARQTSWTDQFSIFEALASSHIWRVTFFYIVTASESNECLVFFKDKILVFFNEVNSYAHSKIIVKSLSKVFLEPYLLSEDEDLNQVGHKRLMSHLWIFKFKYRPICMTSSKAGISQSIFILEIWLTTYFSQKTHCKRTLPNNLEEIHLKWSI